MLHLLRKKRSQKKFVCLPHHHLVDRLAEINALFSGLALYPQVITVWRTHHVTSLSLSTFLIMFATNVVWTIYGIHRRDIAVTLGSGLVVISAGTLSILRLIWG